MESISAIAQSLKHGAIAGRYADRLPRLPESETPDAWLRARLHCVLAQRPELSGLLPAIIHHPGAEQFLREIQ